MEFILGCNYWASNAGTEMWREFDPAAIESDFQILTQHGVKVIRAFPIWRDFQPLMPVYAGGGNISHYRWEDGSRVQDPYGLDPQMMNRFEVFLNLCTEHHLQVVVGLVTGWMSGRLFVPNMLQGRNVIRDPQALCCQQYFIKGFVSRFRDHSAILAWDLGNECNCMGPADRAEAVSWTAAVSNAIRASDPSRPIVSGMHGLEADTHSSWVIQDQAMFTDLLTTHPYPYWCESTTNDPIRSVRTTSHATAQTKFYAELGNRPCMAEEIGTMGPMLASDETAGDFLRLNLFSLWANEAAGVMWWCANDQNLLNTPPYTENMCEVELGMLDSNRQPKPVLRTLKAFSEFLSGLDFKLPAPDQDAVCILTHGQKQWSVAYMTYILARQAGINLRFAFCDSQIPQSRLYILPSVRGTYVMPKEQYLELQKRVQQGAELYLSLDDCVLSGFTALTGLQVQDSWQENATVTVDFKGQKITSSCGRIYDLKAVDAEVLARDNRGNIAVARHAMGKGQVTTVNFPLEADLIRRHRGFDGTSAAIYRQLFRDLREEKPVWAENPDLFITIHRGENAVYAVLINHTGSPCVPQLHFAPDWRVDHVFYGSTAQIPGMDACVISLVQS